MSETKQGVLDSDKKGFLEQLRLINLSVIATCLLLFVGVNFQSNSVLNDAYKDAGSIRRNAGQFVSGLKSIKVDLESQIQALMRKQPLQLYLGRTRLDIIAHDYIFYDITVAESDRSDLSILQSKDLRDFSSTLAHFRKLWDQTYAFSNGTKITNWDLKQASQSLENFKPFSSKFVRFGIGSPFTLKPGEEQKTPGAFINGNPPEIAGLSLEKDKSRQRWILVIHFSLSYRKLFTTIGPPLEYSPPFKISVPLEMVQVDEDVQAMAAQSLKEKVSWPSGTFQESFPDLSRIAKGLDSLELNQLEEHIRELRASGSESVEIFGAKLPVDFLRTWGILLLSSIQLYYYLHIRQFHLIFGSERDEPSFPWIACIKATSRALSIAHQLRRFRWPRPYICRSVNDLRFGVGQSSSLLA
jgi:hypothetical protein